MEKNCVKCKNGIALLEPFAGHIVTDPPYEMDMDALAMKLRSLASGTVIMFSYLGDVPRGADEYHVWVKPESTKNFSRKCGNFVEAISIFRGDNSPFNGKQMHWSQLTGVHRDRLVHKTLHPYQKPLTLMKRLVELYTDPDDLVVDPFCGSGTTLLAAKQLGREWLGFEQDPERHAVAASRLAD